MLAQYMDFSGLLISLLLLAFGYFIGYLKGFGDAKEEERKK